MNFAVPLAEDVLCKLATKAGSSAIVKLERKISGIRAARAEKEFTLLISNKNMNDIKILKVIKKFRYINWWCYWNSKTWSKKTRRWISWCHYGTHDCFIDSNCGLVIDTFCGFFINKFHVWKRSHGRRKRTRRWDSLPLMMKVLEKRVTRAEKGVTNLSLIRNLGLMVSIQKITYLEQKMECMSWSSMTNKVKKHTLDFIIYCQKICVVFVVSLSENIWLQKKLC